MKHFYLYLIFFPFFIYGANITTQVRGNDFHSFEQPWKKFKFDGASEMECAIPLLSNFSIWGNSTPGTIEQCDGDTEEIKTISCGLKYTLPITQCLFPYIGGGANFSNLRKVDFPTIKSRVRDHDFDYVGKSGVIFFMTSHLFVDIFGDYYFSKHNTLQNFNFSGIFKTGIGLGIGF